MPTRHHSYDAVKEVIVTLRGDHGAKTAQGEFSVEATVRGTSVFDGVATCVFSIDHHAASVSVYWEEAGFENYKSKGLFGKMSTGFQTEMSVQRGGILFVQDPVANYQIHINYKS